MEKEQSVYNAMQELAKAVVNAMRAIAKVAVQIVEAMISKWKEIKDYLEEDNDLYGPKKRYNVIKDTRRGHQVITNRPMNTIRRMNM